MRGPDTKRLNAFRRMIRAHFRKHRRDFPWRRTRDSYRILVSEFMLQQTQTSRVLHKYQEFLAAFPNFRALANADHRSVLAKWQGLGYNRRALHLKRLAEEVVRRGGLPQDRAGLLALPGVGQSTAGAVLAFAFGRAEPFIETNIRRAYIHFFFPERRASDGELLPLIDVTLDRKNPREWYYALMDYGAHLATLGENPNRRSATYKIQAKFKGSVREMRGRILALLLARGDVPRGELRRLEGAVGRKEEALEGLLRDGFIVRSARGFRIAEPERSVLL